MGCVGTVIALFVLGSFASRLPKSESTRLIEAEVEIEQRVRQSLKNPDAAKFPEDRQTIVKTGDGHYRGVGVVYSTNSFNAVVPETYICEIEFVAEDKVRLHHLQVGDQVAYSRSQSEPSQSYSAPSFIPAAPPPQPDPQRGAQPNVGPTSLSMPRARFRREERVARRAAPLQPITRKVAEAPKHIPLAGLSHNGLTVTARLAPLGDGQLGGNLEGFAFHQVRSWPVITLRYRLMSRTRSADVVTVVVRNVQQEIRQTFQVPYRTANVTGAELIEAVGCPRPVPGPQLVGDDGFWISDQGSVRVQIGSFPPGGTSIPCLIYSDRVYEKVAVDLDLFDGDGRFLQTTRTVALNVEPGSPKSSQLANPNPRATYYRLRGISGNEFRF